MFFHELLEIKKLNICNELIDELDKWLAFMPKSEREFITATTLSNKFSIDYSLAEIILIKLEEYDVLQENFLIVCPECGREIFLIDKENVLSELEQINYCIKCSEEIELTMEDIYRCYRLIKYPTVSENEIKEYAKNLFQIKDSKIDLLDERDSLEELIKSDKVDVNDFFTSPLKRKRKK